MRARCPRKTQHQELITGGDEIRFVASLGRGGGGRDSVIHFGIIVIQLSVLLADQVPWDPSISWWTNYSSSFYNLINSNFSTVFLFFNQNVKISKSQETFRASCTKKKGKEKKERNKYSNSGRKGTIIGANGKRDLPRRIVGRRGEKEREGGRIVFGIARNGGRIDRSEINAPIRQEHLLVCADHVEQTRPRDRNTRLLRLLRVIHPMGCFNDDISGATGLVNLSTIKISPGILC